MALKPLNTSTTRFATLKPFELKIDDHVYVIKPVDADVGLFLTELFATISAGKAAQAAGVDFEVAEGQALRLQEMMAELNDDDLLARMLGADNLTHMRRTQSSAVVTLVVQTVIYWTVSGREAGEAFWNTGGHPKAKTPADRKPKKKAATKAV